MGSSIKLGRVLGVEIGIHWSWIFIFAIVTYSFATGVFEEFYPGWSDGQKWLGGAVVAVVFFLSVLAHELSHAVVSNRTGLPVNSITLFVFGGVANLTRDPDSPAQEFRIAIVGPLTSLTIGGLFAAAWAIAYQFNEGIAGVLLNLAFINIALAVFNMLPGYPLDGGRVFRSIAWARSKNRLSATRLASRGGEILGFAMMGVGLLEIVLGYWGGAWTLLIGLFLRNIAVSSYQQLETESTLSGVVVRDVMSRDFETVEPTTTIDELIQQHVLIKDARCFAVMAAGSFAGLVTLTDIRSVPREDWLTTTTYRAMTPATRVHLLAPDQGLSDALQLLAQHDVNQLPVIENGTLVGILARADVVRYLQWRKERRDLAGEDTAIPRAS